MRSSKGASRLLQENGLPFEVLLMILDTAKSSTNVDASIFFINYIIHNICLMLNTVHAVGKREKREGGKRSLKEGEKVKGGERKGERGNTIDVCMSVWGKRNVRLIFHKLMDGFK